mmetsp:Transcript_128579/g.411079  ORF Transcript_128579/g.411079 Transcript_128579/m.411079 type:complete len:260 (+) Transcript_128579:1421-2200(+)
MGLILHGQVPNHDPLPHDHTCEVRAAHPDRKILCDRAVVARMRNRDGRRIRVAVQVTEERGQKLHHEVQEREIPLNSWIESVNGELHNLGDAKYPKERQVVLPEEPTVARDVARPEDRDAHRGSHVCNEKAREQEAAFSHPSVVLVVLTPLLVQQQFLQLRVVLQLGSALSGLGNPGSLAKFNIGRSEGLFGLHFDVRLGLPACHYLSVPDHTLAFHHLQEPNADPAMLLVHRCGAKSADECGPSTEEQGELDVATCNI